jgi:hypothetical protein
MEVKYDLEFNNAVIDDSFYKIINKVYKLLPTREEGLDWRKPLETVIEEFAGMAKLIQEYEKNYKYFLVLCKLEGLFSLDGEEDFQLYRRIIFECLGLLGDLKNDIRTR